MKKAEPGLTFSIGSHILMRSGIQSLAVKMEKRSDMTYRHVAPYLSQ
jgi:hypothetical protein